MAMITLVHMMEPRLPVIHRAPKKDWCEFLGYKIASPIGIAACAVTTSKGIALAAKLGCDVLTYKTIRCYTWPPHPQPNITYIDQSVPLTHDDIGKTITAHNNEPTHSSDIAIANSFGNPSMDADWTKNDIQKAKQSLLEGQVLIVSIFGNTLDEWITTAQLAVESDADIVEANFSCPNLNTNNEPIYTRPEDIFSIAQALVQSTPCQIPIILKFGVFTNYQLMKQALIAAATAGVKGICGINSVPSKVVNSDGTSTFGTRTIAGISGMPIQELALDFIKTASTIIQKENLNLILIGVGGITMASHFSQFFAAGATIALSATGMMYNPYLAAEYHAQSHNATNTPRMNKEELAHKLFDIGVITFGDFTFKSGIRSNNYIDMRIAISHPDILQELALRLKDILQMCHADVLCAVPYAAVPVTTALSMISETPMIMARKEAKDHGTKNMIEGVYIPGQECLIIEDVVTTGSSILETIKTVETAGLKVKDVVVLIDRQQGGTENITRNGYRLHSLFTLQELLDLLKKSDRISQETIDTLHASCEQTKHSSPHDSNTFLLRGPHSAQSREWGYKQRAAYCANPIAQRLLTIMEAKKTNLIFSVDVTNKTKLMQLADLVGPEICVLKIHCDIIDDYDQDFPEQLRAVADKHNFLIWEDRKFADIGSTTLHQYTGGVFRIAEWADIVTVHSIAGNGTIEALRSTPATQNSAFLLIAQMSSANALTQQSYTDATVKLALDYPENVIGVICRQKLSDNPGLLHVTPGVQLAEGSDAFGQQYLTPEKVINELGSDIIIVGRGILQAQDPVAAAQQYKRAGWDAYLQKINQE
jgi:uridine monophosphate synthetase